MLELRLLPARQGDALWLRWGKREPLRQLIIDMGTSETGKNLRTRLEALPPDQRKFELLVVTHIDSDHIGGVLSCLVEAKKKLPSLEFGDIWFNGLDHLEEARRRTLEEQRGVQGAALVKWLARQPWNQAFGGGAVCREGRPRSVMLPGKLKLTVLGPTRQRLAELAPVWKEEVRLALKKKRERARRALEELGRKKQVKPTLAALADLKRLAAKVSGQDPSKANGSSILLLVEYDGRRLLLTGDAYAQDIVDGIDALGGSAPLALDAFKLPHHGSRENTTAAMIERVDCPLFLVSTDGTQFEHPHAEAVACVLASSRRKPAGLAFNARRKFTGWDNPDWQRAFRYVAEYGDDDGYLLRFP